MLYITSNISQSCYMSHASWQLSSAHLSLSGVQGRGDTTILTPSQHEVKGAWRAIRQLIYYFFSSQIWFFFSCLEFFGMWSIFKVFIEFVAILLLFYALVFWSRNMWGLNFPIRDWTLTPCIGRWSLNHWTTREVPIFQLLNALPRAHVDDFCPDFTGQSKSYGCI